MRFKILAAVGFEPTPTMRLVPKTSALDHSATLPQHCLIDYEMYYIYRINLHLKGTKKMRFKILAAVGFEPTPTITPAPRPLGHIDYEMYYISDQFTFRREKKMRFKILAAVGFEPTPTMRLVPKTSALDHSATLPQHLIDYEMYYIYQFTFKGTKKMRFKIWQRWDSNPRLR
ncbi:hypothetical protein TNCV_778471 [Trichonephila clavipes]|nr:hypothetical protein TNCV_778471 [Trichonephila clavipes]